MHSYILYTLNVLNIRNIMNKGIKINSQVKSLSEMDNHFLSFKNVFLNKYFNLFDYYLFFQISQFQWNILFLVTFS